ncbi:(2E,6E)-farnesyl diphosphate synthase [Kitasatospora phosalacinea]|uniref:(2E,6E)-farnesyl diphosphate synthase n=1 Tax=Kitasatospora phosalacinea TaxID=2065 RepID=A0A9W6Q9J2_9ACTN|nr:(2E,6E)-farnesyl diphosphate synthase [Kitasatospora phosalacinea]
MNDIRIEPTARPDALDLLPLDGADVLRTLELCRDLVAPALREAVSGLPPDIGRAVEYTLGWRSVEGLPQQAGGKALRPALALLAAQAVGAPPRSAVPAAVAVELVHVFSLVHDDIMDGDEQRRHRPSVWKAYGVGPAVLVGDALLALALDSLARATSGRIGAAALTFLSSSLVELVAGQAEDISFEDRPWTGQRAVTVAEYNAMADRKTASLLGCASGLGALLGGADAAQVAELTLVGRHLGRAFQASDDLLGIWGDPDVTGKPVFNDLRQGKKTLPVIAALGSAAPAARLLAALLGSGEGPGVSDEQDLRDAAELIAAAGGRSFAAEAAARHLEQATRIITGTAVESGAANALAAIGRFAVHRSH